MSLLMEALKKAEEARRQSEGKNAKSVPAVSLTEPALAPAPALSPLSPPSGAIDTIDAVGIDPAASNPAPPDLPSLPNASPVKPAPHPPLTGGHAERSAARNVFTAKQPVETVSTLWWVAGAAVLAILGVGGYFWWQVLAMGRPELAHAPSGGSAAAQAASVGAVASQELQIIQLPPVANRAIPMETAPASPAPESPAAVAIMPDSAVPSAPALPTEERGTFRPPEAVLPLPSAAASVASAASLASRAPKKASTAARERPARAETAVHLTRASPPQTNAVLEHAYEALQSGRDEEAQRHYEQVLQTDAKNTDAWLGLATLAARQGQTGAAHTYYLRALEADPGDSTARAGALNTDTNRPPDDAENLLKTALARQPASPPLLVALGNLYTRQQRWNEAQQVYFDAYTGEPDNPDIIFNLAVSLDHLRQSKLAAQYYQRALKAGDTRTVAFDRESVKTRLLELQP
jgi:Tfp pilus assembly protein PilF